MLLLEILWILTPEGPLSWVHESLRQDNIGKIGTFYKKYIYF